MEDIINKIIQTLDNDLKEKGDYAQFDNKNYKPTKLSKENFHGIKSVKTNKKIAFVDGGNAEILSAANFSLQLIRICYTIYEDNKRIKLKIFEFYSLISALNEEDKIRYKTKTFPINYHFNSLSFDSLDKTIKEGNNRIKASKIGEIMRKLAEIKVAEELIDELNNEDIIVRDGDLKAVATYEKEYLKNLYEKASEKNVVVAALSKTSELFTDKGNSLLVALNDLSPKIEWYYYPLVEMDDENHKSDIYMIKLNKNSDYIFKFEVFRNNEYEINRILSSLKRNAVDPIFMGYPYGLIEADKFARISNKAVDSLKIQFIAKANRKWNRIKNYLNTTNAHDILDKIS